MYVKRKRSNDNRVYVIYDILLNFSYILGILCRNLTFNVLIK